MRFLNAILDLFRAPYPDAWSQDPSGRCMVRIRDRWFIEDAPGADATGYSQQDVRNLVDEMERMASDGHRLKIAGPQR